jgi:hypothetical protein
LGREKIKKILGKNKSKKAREEEGICASWKVARRHRCWRRARCKRTGTGVPNVVDRWRHLTATSHGGGTTEWTRLIHEAPRTSGTTL